MGLERLNITPLLRGHWKGLSDGRPGNSSHGDRAAKITLVGASLVVGVLAFVYNWTLPSATPVLTGVALLAGATLSAFSSLSTLRLRMTDQESNRLQIDRDAIDETVAHILTVSLLCVIDAVLLVVGLNAVPDGHGGIGARFAAFPITVSVYMALLFAIALPRLYSAYATFNHVRPALSGLHKGQDRFQDWD